MIFDIWKNLHSEESIWNGFVDHHRVFLHIEAVPLRRLAGLSLSAKQQCAIPKRANGSNLLPRASDSLATTLAH